MDTWSLPKARPISCNDCPAFQRDHMSVRWFAESFTRLPCVINTTFREKIYIRWCCNDRLSGHRFSECGFFAQHRNRTKNKWVDFELVLAVQNSKASKGLRILP